MTAKVLEISSEDFELVYDMMYKAAAGESNLVVVDSIARLLLDICDSSDLTLDELLEELENRALAHY